MSMLRVSALQAVKATSRSNARFFRPSLAYNLFVRFESTQPPPPGRPTLTPEEKKASIKAAQERADELTRDWDAKVITYEELKPKTQSPAPNSFLIDVREPDEVIQGMIPSAVNLPLTVLAESLHLPPQDFTQKYGFEKPSQDQELTFYCRSGKRSTTACDIAKRNGYTNILNFTGSWLDWIEREGKK